MYKRVDYQEIIRRKTKLQVNPTHMSQLTTCCSRLYSTKSQVNGYTIYHLSYLKKYEAHIMNMYRNSLVAMHQGPYKTFLTIRKRFHFPNMLPKLQRYIKACTIFKEQSRKELCNIHTMAVSLLIMFRARIWQ